MINPKFLLDNKDKLIQIYQKEKYFNNNGLEGALMINFTNSDKVDVYYYTLKDIYTNNLSKYQELLETEIKKNINKKNVVYIILYDNKEAQIMTYNL
tara:strand:- start:45 stop:335 length:291 start_codon:yes stop_codon:yes gene_type:complete